MDDIFALGFEYKQKNYQALIRTKRKLTCTQYYITVMNGDLERLLFGSHVIIEKDGELIYEEHAVKTIHELKHSIVTALEAKLKQEDRLVFA